MTKESKDYQRVKKILSTLNGVFGSKTLFSERYRSVSILDEIVKKQCTLYLNEVKKIQKRYSRVRFIDDYHRFELVSMVIGCTDEKSSSFGTSYIVVNKKILDKKLKIKLEQLGEIGEKRNVPNSTSNIIGKCAEVKAANPVLNHHKSSDIRKLRFTKARRPRTSQVHKRCPNCVHVFGEE